MQQHLPQTPPMPFPVKHENLQDSYYQQQLNQQPIMAPVSPPVAVSSPPSIQIPAPRSSPVGKNCYLLLFMTIRRRPEQFLTFLLDLTTNILNAFNKTVQLGNHSREDINMLMSTAPEEVAEIEMVSITRAPWTRKPRYERKLTSLSESRRVFHSFRNRNVKEYPAHCSIRKKYRLFHAIERYSKNWRS